MKQAAVWTAWVGILSIIACGPLPSPPPATADKPAAAAGLTATPVPTPPGNPVEAMMHGMPDTAVEMLERGMDPNQSNTYGDTVLIWAANTKNADLMRLALAKGADPNHRGSYGKTALHWAAEANRMDLCRLLLQQGALIDTPSLRGDTPLMSALRKCAFETVADLVGAGAVLDQVPDGKDPLALALDLKFTDMLRQPAILEKYPDLEERLKAAQTAVVVNADQQPPLDLARLSVMIHERVNARRAEFGLAALRYDENLARVARGHSADMAARAFFSHTNPDAEDPRDRAERAGVSTYKKTAEGYKLGLGENIYKSRIYSGTAATFEGSRKLITKYWRDMDTLADNTVDGWMNSPGHRENILNPIYETEGIGLHVDADGLFHATQNLF